MSNHVKIYGVKPRIQYTANGSSTSYDFPFAIFNSTDLDVYLSDTLQSSSTYTVSSDDYSNGGTVTFATAPTSGTVVTIMRNLSIERTTDFQEGSILRAEVLNDELDYQIACQQQIAENLNRSMVLPPYAADSDLDLTLPTPSAGKAIVWNSDGTNLENSTVEVNVLESTLNSYKTAAETAATTATTKAGIASDKADIATAKAQIATDKAAEAVSTLSGKANKDMDNLSADGKKAVLGLSIPNYTGVTEYTENTTFYADKDYYAICYVINGNYYGNVYTDATLQTNLYYWQFYIQASANFCRFPVCIVPKGTYYTSNAHGFLYPFKGETI